MPGSGPPYGSVGSGHRQANSRSGTFSSEASLADRDLGADETRQGRIHRILRNTILSGGIAPGARLREAELSGRFGSSRAPLREAIRRLESEGLVQSDFWRGSRVAEYTPTELYELYTLRGLIEGYAATLLTAPLNAPAQVRMAHHLDAMAAAARSGDWLAVARLDTAWHREIMIASGQPVLLRAWESANGPLQMTFGQVAGAFYRRDHIHSRHEAVLAALGGPAARTEAIIRRHYLETAERLLATVASGDPAERAPLEGANAALPRSGRTELPNRKDPYPTGENV
jgi:DNA-binding GntR family transcriptional regulator